MISSVRSSRVSRFFRQLGGVSVWPPLVGIDHGAKVLERPGDLLRVKSSPISRAGKPSGRSIRRGSGAVPTSVAVCRRFRRRVER
jgi:hypothetical protein